MVLAGGIADVVGRQAVCRCSVSEDVIQEGPSIGMVLVMVM
jgi:hypothetical protein